MKIELGKILGVKVLSRQAQKSNVTSNVQFKPPKITAGTKHFGPNTRGTKTGGIQEALNWAHKTGKPVTIQGGVVEMKEPLNVEYGTQALITYVTFIWNGPGPMVVL